MKHRNTLALGALSRATWENLCETFSNLRKAARIEVLTQWELPMVVKFSLAVSV